MRRMKKPDGAVIDLGCVVVGRGKVWMHLTHSRWKRKYRLAANAMDERGFSLSDTQFFDLPQPASPRRFSREVMSSLAWALPYLLGDEHAPVHQFVMRVASMAPDGAAPLRIASASPSEVSDEQNC